VDATNEYFFKVDMLLIVDFLARAAAGIESVLKLISWLAPVMGMMLSVRKSTFSL
jgi:hypothetical protein